MTTRIYDEIVVKLEQRSYPVIVGEEVRNTIDDIVPADVAKVAIVTQRDIGILPDLKRPFEVFYIEDGEPAKSLETVGSLCNSFANMGMNRKDLVLAIGGGVVSDTAGFAAATFHRGIRYGTIATTLLSQVDAAIGGKTGVNIPAGKNLVGAFWQPSFVLCEVDSLSTLSEREYLCGLGEMAKYAFLGAEGLQNLPLHEQIAACVRIKAAFVENDEREGNRRALLNYGHTLAHALEAIGFDDARVNLKHGEAVAIGLVFAARLAKLMGRISDERVLEHYKVVRAYGLPDQLPVEIDADKLIELMAKDKKSYGSLTFVLDSSKGVEVVSDVDTDLVMKAIESLSP